MKLLSEVTIGLKVELDLDENLDQRYKMILDEQLKENLKPRMVVSLLKQLGVRVGRFPNLNFKI